MHAVAEVRNSFWQNIFFDGVFFKERQGCFQNLNISALLVHFIMRCFDLNYLNKYSCYNSVNIPGSKTKIRKKSLKEFPT